MFLGYKFKESSIMKYIIAVNENYYPSVEEFDNEKEAKERYNDLVVKLYSRYKGVPKDLIENKTIYFCEVKDFAAVLREN